LIVRLLFVSNFYPPHARGGYEQWCQEVADEFAARGHHISVLTARAPSGSVVADAGSVRVERRLHLEVVSGLAHTLARLVRDRHKIERENLEHVANLIAEFRPDAALVWGMWNVPRSVAALLEELMPGRVAYYFCDYWPSLPTSYEQQLRNPASHWQINALKRLLCAPFLAKLARERSVSLRFDQPICVSHAVRDLLVTRGVPVEHARIIPGGIQIDQFRVSPDDDASHQRQGLRLLYVGRLAPEKGVHTVIRALAHLAQQGERSVTLNLVGASEGGYIKHLQQLVKRYGLGERVTFRGGVARAEIPRILAEHDALVFPSEWAEPFARTVLEAMAAELIVIGTTTGGTGEVLVDGETGLTFAAGDANGLAIQIRRLRDDSASGRRWAAAALQRVETKFTFGRMVDELEATLKTLRPRTKSASVIQ
jgi:glycogen synthase